MHYCYILWSRCLTIYDTTINLGTYTFFFQTNFFFVVFIVQCNPSMYDFGVMIVGTSKYCHLSLSNSGPCDMKYSLNSYYQNGELVSGLLFVFNATGVI